MHVGLLSSGRGLRLRVADARLLGRIRIRERRTQIVSPNAQEYLGVSTALSRNLQSKALCPTL